MGRSVTIRSVRVALKKIVKGVLPQTLFGRSLLILITPIILIQCVLTFMFFDKHWERMTARLAFALAGEVVMIADLVDTYDTIEAQQEVIATAENHLDFLISIDEGETLDNVQRSDDRFSFDFGWEKTLEYVVSRELSTMTDRHFTVMVDLDRKWTEIRVQIDDGIMNVAMPRRRLFSSTTYIFLLWVFGTSVVVLVIAVLFMRNQIRPIRRLAMAAERFGKGRGDTVFKVEGAREVRQAGQAFIDMKTRIKRQVSQRTEMLAGVSHDLRTPLTRLKLQLAMLGDGSDVYDMKKDIAEMEVMIDGYLNFVRGAGNEVSQRTDLLELMKGVVHGVKRYNGAIHLDMSNAPRTAIASVRPVSLKRAISNIVDNGLKYGDIVWVSVTARDASCLRVIVDDDGVGLRVDQYDDVLRPFFRTDTSRNLDVAGVGLGLSVTADIIHAHGGEIMFDKSPHGGLRVMVDIPL